MSTKVSDEAIWADDLLNRQQDADFLVSFLRSRIRERIEHGEVGSYVLNLDAGWGKGKTFFLERLLLQLRGSGNVAVYVNAWRDDHADDPMLAVMSAIDDAIAPFLVRKKALQKVWRAAKNTGVEVAITAAKHAAKTIAKKLISAEGVDGIAEVVGKVADAPQSGTLDHQLGDAVLSAVEVSIETVVDKAAAAALEEFRQDRDSIVSFRDRLGALLSQMGAKRLAKLPVFILVDELDRCRPSYAIKLLERVKHLFEVSNVAFVLATDSAQLRHSIKAVYGDTFDSGAYLRRFFDRTYVFEEPALEEFVREAFARTAFPVKALSLPRPNQVEDFFVSTVRFFDLSLRDIEQCLDIVHTVATVWRSTASIQFIYLLPLVVAFQQSDAQLFEILSEHRPNELSAVIQARGRPWKMRILKSDDGYGYKDVEIGVLEYLTELLRQLPVSLSRLGKTDRAGEPAAGIQHVLLHEMDIAQREGRSPPKSLMRSYPELVRNAGRIQIAGPTESEV